MSSLKTFFNELRRRKIWLVGGVYIVAAWIIAQAASLVLPNFAAPGWVMPVLLIVLGLGLPLAIILAWAQETQGAHPPEPEAEPAPQSGRPAIAVLPFTNMSDDADQEYMADGMTEDVITLLSQSSGLDVTARNSVFAYKGQSPDIREVGRDLNVNFVTEGSIRQVGQTIRCAVQLIDVTSGNHVWAQQFDRPRDAFFDLQDEIVAEIVMHISATVAEDIRLTLRQRDDASLDAWGMIVRSSDFIFGSSGDAERAIDLLNRALQIEPENPLAHGSIALWLANKIAWSLSDDPVADERKALEHMRIAQANGRHQAAVINVCATATRLLGDQERSLELCQEAEKLTPGSRESAVGYALLFAGHLDEGLEMLEDQHKRLGAHFRAMPGLAQTLLLRGRFEEAEAVARQSMTLERFRMMGALSLANILGRQGRLSEAREAWGQAVELRPDLTLQIAENYNKRLWANADHAEAASAGLKLALQDR